MTTPVGGQIPQFYDQKEITDGILIRKDDREVSIFYLIPLSTGVLKLFEQYQKSLPIFFLCQKIALPVKFFSINQEQTELGRFLLA